MCIRQKPCCLRTRYIQPMPRGPPAAGRRAKRSSRSSKRAGVSASTFTARSIWRPVSYTHLRAHETRHDIVCRLLLEKKKKKKKKIQIGKNKKKKTNKTKKKKEKK